MQSGLLRPEAAEESQRFRPMNRPPYKVLMLCTGNSARSILAEYLLRAKGKGRFETYSAGAKPTGKVNPLALWVLKAHYGLDASDARSKSWDEFQQVKFDVVVTVCDHAKESCPVFLGHPTTAHFGSPDPAECDGTEEQKQRLFLQVATQISRRLDLFCALPDDQLEPLRVRGIGEQFRLGEQGAPATP
jgi:arsenate reductase